MALSRKDETLKTQKTKFEKEHDYDSFTKCLFKRMLASKFWGWRLWNLKLETDEFTMRFYVSEPSDKFYLTVCIWFLKQIIITKNIWFKQTS